MFRSFTQLAEIVPSRIFLSFFRSERAGGLVLFLGTVASLLLANSGWSEGYRALWHTPVFQHSLVHWINDGLMAIFFLMIGLELEREIYRGELSDLRNAALPLMAALGGMLIPAALFSLVAFSTPAQDGVGIPMATDIAFAIGVLSLLGNRVPASLKVFLTALAVADDLGAILLIAVFYTQSLALGYLLGALAVFGALLLLGRLGVKLLLPYLLGGCLMWFLMLQSGVHATLAGVLLAFTIPFGDGTEGSASCRVLLFLHKPVAFVILPMFAMANTALVIPAQWYSGLASHESLGILLGLVLGKPLGVLLFSMLSVSLGMAVLPRGVRWRHIAGIGSLAGIGFTMSIFVTLLAFQDAVMVDHAKIAILLSSVASGVFGWLLLSLTLPRLPRGASRSEESESSGHAPCS